MRSAGFYARYGKRGFDFAVALVGMVILLMPLVMLGLLIWVVDGRPVIFRQPRVGRQGRLFQVCKFRTMTNRRQSTSTITVAGDVRITPVGRCLRRFKLDELPQLYNVLVGQMSLVAPDPMCPVTPIVYRERPPGYWNCVPALPVQPQWPFAMRSSCWQPPAIRWLTTIKCCIPPRCN